MRTFAKPTALFALVGFLSSCGAATSGAIAARAGELGHIHDLVQDSDGTLLVASHSGLYRIEGPDRAVLVGDNHDLMSLATLSDDRIIASGHPNLLMNEFRINGLPPVLGLAESADGGATWRDIELLGEADFHAIVEVGKRVFVAEARGRIWVRESNGEWNVLGEVAARDLAINPKDSSMQIAADYDGTPWLSTDEAVTWQAADRAPVLVEVEWPRQDEILGVDASGAIWQASSPTDAEWSRIATGPDNPETFLVDENDTWWVAAGGGAILRSSDRGGTWDPIYSPPQPNNS